MKTLFRAFLDLLFPPLCAVCGKGLVEGEHFICTACLADFPFSDKNYGNHLDIPIDKTVCLENVCSLFYYHKYSMYKNLIHAVKYHSRSDIGRYLGHMLGEKIKNDCRADCIIPIPLHKKREKKRGFNQAYEIAVGVREVLGLEIWDDVVIRTDNNISQTGMNAVERRKNVENIFKLVNPERIAGHHLLVIDDVITTGATVGSCMKVLAQAEEVKFTLACLAKTEV